VEVRRVDGEVHEGLLWWEMMMMRLLVAVGDGSR
jgi:hypothetical protein